MPKLGVVVASVREGRVGLPVAEWFMDCARKHGAFEATLLDLKAIALPLLTEPEHPRLQKYTQDKTKAWSATVAAMDAFVLVTPEYNFSSAPALVNALDHLYVEWNYKPAGFVSYGGASGGMRAVQATKPLVTTLKMMPMVEAVAIPFVQKLMEGGSFKGGDPHDKAAATLLTELAKWTAALATLRVSK